MNFVVIENVNVNSHITFVSEMETVFKEGISWKPYWDEDHGPYLSEQSRNELPLRMLAEMLWRNENEKTFKTDKGYTIFQIKLFGSQTDMVNYLARNCSTEDFTKWGRIMRFLPQNDYQMNQQLLENIKARS